MLGGLGKARDRDEYHRLAAIMDPATANYVERSAEDRARAKLSEKLIERICRRCPNKDCAWPIMINKGCYIVECWQCHTSFCYVCCGIRSLDARYIHRLGCPFGPLNSRHARRRGTGGNEVL